MTVLNRIESSNLVILNIDWPLPYTPSTPTGNVLIVNDNEILDTADGSELIINN